MLLVPRIQTDTPLLGDVAAQASELSAEPEAGEDPAPASQNPSPSPAPPKGAEAGEAKAVDSSKLAGLVPGGQVSVVVYDRTAKTNTVSLQPDRGYTSASLVKILIALETLQRGGSTASVQRMLSASDDTLASMLWSTNGGASIVTSWAKKIGLSGTRAPEDPGRWGDTRITANDIAKIYRYILEQAPGGSRSVIMRALSGATENGSDGIRQYFGIPDAVGTLPWSIKQGWACCRGSRILHTSGAVGDGDRYIVVVLTSQPTSTTWASGGRRVTAVVSALLPALKPA